MHNRGRFSSHSEGIKQLIPGQSSIPGSGSHGDQPSACVEILAPDSYSKFRITPNELQQEYIQNHSSGLKEHEMSGYLISLDNGKLSP